MASISILPETTMSSNPNPKDFPFPRKIEFLPARKPFDPYSSTSNGDFHLETLNPGAGYQTPVSLGAAAACSPAKKSDGAGELVELGLDPELDFGITFRRIGAGLANLGNTCFLNSVLQCLTYTEPFAAYLQSGKHKTSCRTAGFCALCAIQNHVKNALQSTGKILSPSHFVKNLRCISRNFRNCRQEDAHELMVNLLESMHKCCLPYGVSSETPAAYEKSLVHKIFGGRLRSQVKCMQCSYCSNKYDPFLDLSLEIVRADSLRKALSHFTAEELLDGGEKHYQCQRCKQKVQARKQLTVHKAPYVLTIHLKRFSSHNPGQKIDKKIEFAPSLDLKPFVSGPYDGDLRYTLYGVLVHAGWSTHSGHYYCYVRTSSGMWYTLDDNRVFQVSEKTVLQQKAYMLFYVLDRRNLAPKVPLNKIRNENMSKIVGEQVRLATTMDSKQVSQYGPTNNTIRTDPITSGNHQAPSVCSTLPADTLVKGVLLKDTISLESVSQVMKDSKNMNGTSVNHCLPKKLLSGQSHSEEHVFKDAVLNDADSSPKMVSGKVQEAQKMDGNDSRVPLVEHSSSLHEKELTAMPLNEADPAEREKNVQEAFCKQSNASDGCENGGNSEINFSSKHEEQIKGSVADQSYKCIEAEGVAGQGAKAEGAFVFETVAETSDSCKEPKLKKDVRYPVTAALCIGSKQLFFSSLGIRRKKKLQRMKRLTSDMKQFKKKSSMEEPCSTEQGTSTSESFEGNEPNRACMKKRKGFREVKEVKQHNEAHLDVKQECLVVENGSQISFSTSEQHTEKRKPPIRGQVQSTEPHVCKSGGSVHNVVLSTMPSGLSETTVARWDDIDLPSTDTLNSDVPQMSSSIGYVADAWDEEYDQGKRKKVRKSGIFGGPNPFQEIATQKAESKTMNAKRPSKHWKAASHCRKFQHKKQTRRR